MECQKVKQEFPDIEFESCCLSCHEDEATGFAGDLWFPDINNVERNVCCAVGRSMNANIKMRQKHERNSNT